MMTLVDEHASNSPPLDYQTRRPSEQHPSKRTGGVYYDSTDGLEDISNKSIKSTVNADSLKQLETPAQEIEQYHFALPENPENSPVTRSVVPRWVAFDDYVRLERRDVIL